MRVYTVETRVGASHTGADGLMTLPAAVDMMQDCSQFWLDSEPGLDSYLNRNGLALILSFRQVDTLRLPSFREHLRISTAIYDVNKYFGCRNTAMYGGDGAPCVLSYCVGVFVNRFSWRTQRIPPEVLGGITIDPPLDMEYTGRRVTLPDISFEEQNPFTVPPSYIDLNGHMNNARYFRAAYDLLPGLKASRARIEFAASVPPGAILLPSIASIDKKTYIRLRLQDGKVAAHMEFSHI